MIKLRSIRSYIIRVVLGLLVVGALLNTLFAPSAIPLQDVKSGSTMTVGYDESVPTSGLIDRLRKGNSEFSWNEWLNLRKAESFVNHELDPKLYPLLSTTELSRILLPPSHPMNQHELAMMGRLYCKNYLPAPIKVILLPNPNEPLNNTETEVYYVHHKDSKKCHRQFGHTSPTPQNEMTGDTPLIPELDPKLPLEDKLEIPIDPKLYNWTLPDVIDNNEYHGKTVSAAKDAIQQSTKHFYECALKSDPMGYGGHYDWRFFRGVENYASHTAAVHALGRSWQLFADTLGISYWYAHGALLGWYWNGFTLPWDPDLDIQMPIQELDRLAQHFNRTLVIQHPLEGTRKYLLDVGPWYVDRSQGNQQNIIDARFIDVDTGIYLDITGLSYVGNSAPLALCKNRHKMHIDDISPVRRTLYEGTAAYVPQRVTSILSVEYRLYDLPFFGRWVYKEALRLWELEMTCEDLIRRFRTPNKVYCYPRKIIDNCKAEANSSCNQYILAEYAATKNVTKAHQREFDLWSQQPLPRDELVSIVNTHHPAFHTGPVELVEDGAIDVGLVSINATEMS